MEDTMNPYVGLRPFETDEDLLFFGRDKQTLELLQRLHNHPFLAVVGGSGSGKSSLIRAGLIPALKGGYLVEDSSKWKIAIMKPGQNPMFNFAQAILKQIDTNVSHEEINEFLTHIKKEGITAITERLALLKETKRFNFFLLVDQFEELFRYQMDAATDDGQTEAIDFVNTVLDLTEQSSFPFYIVLTMRSDFIGDCAQFHGLPEALNKSQYLVPRLNREEMKRVIEGPSKLYGKRFSPALTSKLINDTTKVRDELPLLQHALMRIWEHEAKVDKSGSLDLKDYRAVGGIQKALAIHADEALDDMTKKEVKITKVIFKALTAIDENGRKIRRPVLMSELKELTGADEKEIQDILDHFIRDRRSFVYLQDVSDSEDKVIDISHESLIRQWKTLGKWVDQEDEAASDYKKLAEDHRLYKLEKKDLLAGSELQLAIDWHDKFQPTAAWAKRYGEGYEDCMGYLAGSFAARDEQQEIERIRFIRLRNTKRAVMGLLVFIILSGIVLGYITNHNSKTRDLHNEAKLMVSKDPTTALWLAVEANNRSEKGWLNFFYKESEIEDVKKTMQTIYIENSFYKRTIEFDGFTNVITISPNAKTFLTGDVNGVSRVWDMNQTMLGEFKGEEDVAITAIIISPDGKSVLTGTETGTVQLWDIGGALISEFEAHRYEITALAFSPDGKSFITGSAADGVIRLWSTNGRKIKEFKGHKRYIRTLAFAPDGKSILSGAEDGTARLWNLDGTQITVFKGHHLSVYSVAYAPDGRSILTGSYDETARLWDLNGRMITEFRGHQDAIGSVKFSPDGNTVLTGSMDRTARLWDLKGMLLNEFKGHKNYIITMDFTPDGNSIVTGSEDYTVRLWDMKGATLARYEGHNEPVYSVAVAPDGKSILTGSDDGKVILWNINGDTIINYKGHQEMINAVTFSPDGQTALSGGWDNAAHLWNLDGELITKFEGHDGYVASVAFAPDGNFILTGSDDTRARLWNLNGTMLMEFIGHEETVTSVAFAPNGKSILTGSDDETARLWDLDGELIMEFTGDVESISSVAFSPDGQSILTGSEDAIARLYEMDGELERKFIGHNDYITSVAFAPDGNSVLTGSGDRSTILWDLDGAMITKFKGREGDINSVAFTPDGKAILTGAVYGSARLWKIPMRLKDFLDSGQIEVMDEDQLEEYSNEDDDDDDD